jgi:2-oxoglutarate ferredoxin oxidoreductase subunit beta
MIPKELSTNATNTWCPGCGNFAILSAARSVLASLSSEGYSLDNVVLVSGIGCHAKIVDYINVNSFYSIHGRATPAAEGIKIGNPDLTVIGFAGDGDAYGEGIEHLLFAAKRNINITMIIHDNRVYGLTTGQYTPTSPLGFKGRSTPKGSTELPFNPIELMLASGATHVARAYSHGLDFLKKIFREAILHKGFSVIDVLQVCATFFNEYDYYTNRVYDLQDHDETDFDAAMQRAREWDYNADDPIALGTFYKKEAPCFDAQFKKTKEKLSDKSAAIEKFLSDNK